MDGDKLPDIVRLEQLPNGARLKILLNTGQGWLPLQPVILGGGVTGVAPHLEDVNRDGLPDVVCSDVREYPADGHLEADQDVWINRGVANSQTGERISFRGVQYTRSTPGGLQVPAASPPQSGDLDGDGAYDIVSFYSKFNGTTPGFRAGVGLGHGTGATFGGASALAYRSVFAQYAPTAIGGELVFADDYGFALLDVNGDGLADLVRNHRNRDAGSSSPNQGGGQLLINTGTTWKDISGITGWQIPAGALAVPRTPDPVAVNDGSAFVDLDGDGLADLITESPTTHAWLNTYAPPIITGFPNQLALATQVNYVVVTTADAQNPPAGESPTYVETGALDPGTKRATLPLRVVKSVIADTAEGHQTTQKYQYSDLRLSAFDYGPQGFKTMTVTDPSGLVTKTTFAQAYPYTGLPLTVEKSNQGPVTTTKTTYCTSNEQTDCIGPSAEVPSSSQARPPRSTFFPRPVFIEDVTYLRTSTFPQPAPAFTLTVSTFVHDDLGNPTTTNVITHGLNEDYGTLTQNTYGDPGSLEQRLGKVTRTVVTTQRGIPQGPPRSHTTEFEYRTFVGALALSKRKVEPNSPADQQLELHTAYDYDRFGNVITTTDCASNFTDCAAGAAGPADLPFRTMRVSFNKSDFNGPSGPGLISALSYGDGRFPVKTTNALGQSTFAAYDPLLGVVVQATDLNGINICYGYDPIGNKTSDTSRCGSGSPLTTILTRFTTPAVPPPPCNPGDVCVSPPILAKVISVAQPQGATPTWTYADALGRTIMTRTHHFDGTFIESTKSFDPLGRLASETKPYRPGDPVFSTTYTYDPLGRVQTATQDLGSLDGTSSPTSTTTTTTYLPAKIATDHLVGGTVQHREETKNVVGKVVTVGDTDGRPISYSYDADGNLTDTTDPAGNGVHIGYDTRGRKTSSTDPDLGTWTYTYDGFGDLVTQTDAKSQTTTMTYDVLGRMTTRTDATGTAQWVYDSAPAGVGKLAAMVSAPDPTLNGTCDIPFATVTDGNRAGRSFHYNQFGDLETESQCTDGTNFATDYQYDGLGRPSVVRYPAIAGRRLAVESHYTSLGHLQFISDLADGSILWIAKTMNALGQVTDETLKNGVETTSTRNPATGWLLGSQAVAHADSDRLIQKWGYGFDEAGNLTTRDRADAINAATSHETFTYDGINRLDTATVATSDGFVKPEQFVYDSLGNITQKGGQQYFYNTGCKAGSRPAGPHAVCSVEGGSSYSYDANGNLVSGGGRTVSYDPANKPLHMESSSPTACSVLFAYGADMNRVVQIATSGGQTARTLYVGLGGTGKSIYERTTTGDTTEHAQFIYAQGAHGGAAFAIRVSTQTTSTLTATTKYYHFDHLGSVTAMSDEQGRVIASGPDATMMGYDAWGLRRNPDGRPATAPFSQQPGRREFTGHETITGVGLVNMNGRIYDPVLGRFLSPDPNIQFVADLQSYNRYSYVHNNPLSYSDPTGFGLFAPFGLHGWVDTALTIGVAVVGAGICGVSAGAGCAAFGLFAAYLSATSAGVGALEAGASAGQVFGLMGVNFVAGLAGGAAGGQVGGLAGAIVGGGISGAAAAALTTEITNSGHLGRNILLGAAQGAVSGAGAWALTSGLAQVTQAGVAEAQGGGGSGEARITRIEREFAASNGQAGSNGDGGSYAADAERGKAAGYASGRASRAAGHGVGSVRDAESLNTLEPGFREPATRVVDRMVDHGYDVRVVWGRRTQAENQVLVEQGLASPTSKHLTGEAVDLINRANPYPNDHNNAYYLHLRDAVLQERLVWGGFCWGDCVRNRWDPTHFEAPNP
jgi:RHS repeat-associated protein